MSSGDGAGASAFALLVATGSYADPQLAQLRSPVGDASELAAILTDPEIGGYTVRSLVNEQAHLLSEEIEGFLADRRPADTVVLYLSCHGVRDMDGRLRFATVNTKMNRLAATAVSADLVYELVDKCRARNVLVLLDCCYSGAYRKGYHPRSADWAEVRELHGSGRAVITSSTSTEYSYEVDTGAVTGNPVASVFTAVIIEGLRTGKADRDEDGLISVDDLYSYVFDRVREQTPDQTPEKKWGDVRGDFVVARNPRPPADEPLPAELIAALDSPYARVRAGAIEEIAALARASRPGLARAARAALEALLTDDSKIVSTTAETALAALSPPPADKPGEAGDTAVQADREDPPPVRDTSSNRHSTPAGSSIFWYAVYILAPIILPYWRYIRDKPWRANVIQALTIWAAGVLLGGLGLAGTEAYAHIAHLSNQQSGWVASAPFVCASYLIIMSITYCVRQLVKGKQPSIPVISRIANRLAYGPPAEPEVKTAEPEVKTVRQQHYRQSRSTRSGKR